LVWSKEITHTRFILFIFQLFSYFHILHSWRDFSNILIRIHKARYNLFLACVTYSALLIRIVYLATIVSLFIHKLFFCSIKLFKRSLTFRICESQLFHVNVLRDFSLMQLARTLSQLLLRFILSFG